MLKLVVFTSRGAKKFPASPVLVFPMLISRIYGTFALKAKVPYIQEISIVKTRTGDAGNFLAPREVKTTNFNIPGF